MFRSALVLISWTVLLAAMPLVMSQSVRSQSRGSSTGRASVSSRVAIRSSSSSFDSVRTSRVATSSSTHSVNCQGSSSQATKEEIAPAMPPAEEALDVREQSVGGGGPIFDNVAPTAAPMDAVEIDEFVRECADGEFRPSENSNVCAACDSNCQPDRCVDELGCIGCNDGYYYTRQELTTPFQCLACSIPNCVRCQNGVANFISPPKCMQCADRYTLSIDSLVCSPLPSPTEPESAPENEENSSEKAISTVVEKSEEVEEVKTRQSLCPSMYFMSNEIHGCARCDTHAIPGGCRDFIGCMACMPGFFRMRSSIYFPFTCYPCTVENCSVCMDDTPIFSPQKCSICDDGYEVDEQSGQCIAATG